MTELNTLLYNRRSTRKFTEQPVEVKKVEAVLKAALLAPSGKAINPCEFIVIDDPEVLEKLSKVKTHGATFLAKAPVAIAVVANTSKTDVWIEDAAICSAYMILAAENAGLGSCWIQMRLRGTTDGKTATENMESILNLSDEHEVLSIMALGYKAEEKKPYTDDDLNFDKVHHLKLRKKE